MLKSVILAGASALFFAVPALAGDIVVMDPYARVATKASKSGAAFMVLQNQGPEDDRLIDARSDVAKKVELHTHQEDGNGIMKMMHVPEGFAVAAGEKHMLARGGDHVMFMGLNRSLAHGDMVEVTLVFEKAGEIVVQIPVDLERKPMHGGMNHGDMNSGS